MSKGPADTASLVHLTVEDGVATVRMQDTAGNNAMSEGLVEALLAGLKEAGKRDDVRVVVLCGTPEIFSSGASMGMLKELAHGGVAPTDILLPRAVLEVPVPTIAAMAGHAIGGGLALGVCCDLVLLAKESRYGLTFMNYGFTPGMASTRLLEHCLSPALAHELLYTGQAVKGAAFEGRAGFNYLLPRAEVEPKAFELAGRIAEKPRKSLVLLKRVLSLPKRQAFEATHTVESLMHEISFRDPGTRARIEENHAE